jgi:hypothetical protein
VPSPQRSGVVDRNFVLFLDDQRNTVPADLARGSDQRIIRAPGNGSKLGAEELTLSRLMTSCPRARLLNPDPACGAFLGATNRATSSCRRHSGSLRYSGDPCCPAQPPAFRLRAAYGLESMVPEAAKIPFIARIGGIEVSRKAVCHSRANWISGVYVRHLQPTCLCFGSQGLPERRGCRPHAVR